MFLVVILRCFFWILYRLTVTVFYYDFLSFLSIPVEYIPLKFHIDTITIKCSSVIEETAIAMSMIAIDQNGKIEYLLNRYGNWRNLLDLRTNLLFVESNIIIITAFQQQKKILHANRMKRNRFNCQNIKIVIIMIYVSGVYNFRVIKKKH